MTLFTTLDVVATLIMAAGLQSAGLHCQPDQNVRSEHVKASATLVSSSGAAIAVKIQLENVGPQTVLVGFDAKRSDGSIGPYVQIGSDGTLVISYRLFGPPAYELYANGVGMALRHLAPGQRLSRELTLRFPVRETIPPYGDLGTQHETELTSVKKLQVVLGILPDTAAVESVLRRKNRPFWTAGADVIEAGPDSGKTLEGLQYCVAAPEISLSK